MSSPQRRVVFRREALAQLDELYDFVAAAGSPLAAADLVDAIITFTEDLEHSSVVEAALDAQPRVIPELAALRPAPTRCAVAGGLRHRVRECPARAGMLA